MQCGTASMTTSGIASRSTVSTISAGGSGNSAAASADDFTQQLSQALSDSLQSLGKTPADIHIQVQTGSTPATHQFVITYTDESSSGSTASTASTTSGNASATPQSHNPFDGSALPIDVPWASSASSDAPAQQQAKVSTPWSPYNGPCDPRDAVPAGGGQQTASGAPLIQPNTTATSNQYGYSGPAAYNPYFTNPGNPLREGYVMGFTGWFQAAQIVGPKGSMSANELNYANQDGANEALRLVKQYEPRAELTTETFNSGPFAADKPMWMVAMPDGRMLNAGNILNAYYNHGCGVCVSSDAELQQAVGIS